MAILQNTSALPDFSTGLRLLEITAIDVKPEPSFENPAVLEDRVKMQVCDCTPGARGETYHVFMSGRLGPSATLGSIARAIFGPVPKGSFDTDRLIGHQFWHMVGQTDKGWPKLINGTAAPADEMPFADEPPY